MSPKYQAIRRNGKKYKQYCAFGGRGDLGNLYDYSGGEGRGELLEFITTVLKHCIFVDPPKWCTRLNYSIKKRKQLRAGGGFAGNMSQSIGHRHLELGKYVGHL